MGPLFISVIIPVFNRSETIEQCLASVVRHADDHVEVILVDDCSSDDTIERARAFPCRTAALTERVGPGRARNEGALLARGDVLFFLDADCVLVDNVFALIWETFGCDPDLGVLQGWYTRESSCHDNVATVYKDAYYDFFFGRIGRGHVSTVSTHCLAVQERVFEALGRFSLSVKGAIEDGDLGFRLASGKHPIYLEPVFAVQHLKRYTVRSLLKIDARYAFAKVKLLLRELRHGAVTSHGGFNVMLNPGGAMIPFLAAISLSLPVAVLLASLPLLPWPAAGSVGAGAGLLVFYLLLAPLLRHIVRLEGWRTAFAVLPVVYLDCLTMILAILAGAIDYVLLGHRH